MDPSRLVRILSDLDEHLDRGIGVGERLCDACVDVLQVSGAGITLMSDDGNRGSLGGSNAVIEAIEELQYTLGEGPCVDACQLGRPVLEPDLANAATARWPAFSGPAVDAGVRAIFGFPLQAGTISFGALNLYQDRPGDLRRSQADDAMVMAHVAAQTVLTMQADAPPGAIAGDLESTLDHRAVVHQAAGMVSAQLDTGIDDALLRLRAHAYAHGRPINDIARDIVARRLRLDRATEGMPHGKT